MGFISFLNDTKYSTFQGKNISVNYPSSTIKERLPDGIFITNCIIAGSLITVGENITFVNMIFSNLGDYLTVTNHRYKYVLYNTKLSRPITVLEYKQSVIFYQHKYSGINQTALLMSQ